MVINGLRGVRGVPSIIRSFDERARQAGVSVLSGCSSMPILSAAIRNAQVHQVPGWMELTLHRCATTTGHPKKFFLLI
ncbi:hypothetical protein PSFL111601_16175 [Pseudomonas floridensis]